MVSERVQTGLRERLMDALDVLEKSRPTSFEAAFELLATYLPGNRPQQDEQLASRFRDVIASIQASKGYRHGP